MQQEREEATTYTAKYMYIDVQVIFLITIKIESSGNKIFCFINVFMNYLRTAAFIMNHVKNLE